MLASSETARRSRTWTGQDSTGRTRKRTSTVPEANQQHGEIVSDWVNHGHEKHYLHSMARQGAARWITGGSRETKEIGALIGLSVGRPRTGAERWRSNARQLVAARLPDWLNNWHRG
jgi:hypothetical protein